MPSDESHISRMLARAREALTAAEIAEMLNAEVGKNAYTEAEVTAKLKRMSNVITKGAKFKLKREDASQAAARIVREATDKL